MKSPFGHVTHPMALTALRFSAPQSGIAVPKSDLKTKHCTSINEKKGALQLYTGVPGVLVSFVTATIFVICIYLFIQKIFDIIKHNRA